MPRTDTQRRRLLPAVTLGVLCAGVIGMAGCYERVVAARGLGADQYTVSEPYQENSKVDDWLFGPRDAGKPSRRLQQPPQSE